LSSPRSGFWSRGSSALSVNNWLGLIGGVLLTIYLFVALVLPERF
jgi:K+-transporting ATPase KdpF subunit